MDKQDKMWIGMMLIWIPVLAIFSDVMHINVYYPEIPVDMTLISAGILVFMIGSYLVYSTSWKEDEPESRYHYYRSGRIIKRRKAIKK